MKKFSFYLMISSILLLAYCSSESSDWKKAKTQNDVQAYKQFLSKHPGSTLKDSASMKIIELSIKCPIVIGPYGYQMVISLESAKKICNNRIKFINEGEKSRSPITGQDYSDNIIEQIKNDKTMTVALPKHVWAPSGKNILMLKGIGKSSYWLGTDDGTNEFYILGKDSSAVVTIGYKKWIKLSDGNYVRMTKGTDQKDYYAGIYDSKIYKIKGDSGYEQIGTYSYFWIPVENAPQLQRTILMTKGMNPDDKWCGEMDGIIYIYK